MRDRTVDAIVVKYMDALAIMESCTKENCKYMKETEDDETYDEEDYMDDFEDLIGNECRCNCVDSMFF